MKRRKMIGSLMIVLVFCMMLSQNRMSVRAEEDIPRVTYNGTAHEFTFDKVQNSDLFELYKGVLPGDTRQQDISLETTKLENETELFLRAECDEDVRTVLQDVTMDVYLDDVCIVEGQLVFDDVSLGIYKTKEAEQKITAVLHVPTSLGNEIAGKEFHVQWIFTAQEDGKLVADDSVPTGDNTNWGKYVILMIVSMIAICYIQKNFEREVKK